MTQTPLAPPDPSPPAKAASSPTPRMMSVDALRGFDMFWIIGGEEVAKALDKIGGGPVVSAIATQFKHVTWEGFHFYDGIFPLFLFLVGVSIVFSLDRVRRDGGQRAALGRIARRSLLLFAIGVLYYGGLAREWPDIALSGVLPRIALCYFAAATLYIFLPRKGIVAAAIACLVGYWALLTYTPFPDVKIQHSKVAKKGTQAEAKPPEQLFAGAAMTHGIYEEGRNLAHYVDARWLPGKQNNLYYTNEGLLSTIPSIATTLFGIMAGWVLTAAGWSERKKVVWLLGAGALGIALGLLWGLQFPIIKRIWTSSFCLVSAGFSALLLGALSRSGCLALAALVRALPLDRRQCTLLAVNLISFDDLAQCFVGGEVRNFFDLHLAAGSGDLLIALISLLLPVLMVRFLYQRKIFIRL